MSHKDALIVGARTNDGKSFSTQQCCIDKSHKLSRRIMRVRSVPPELVGLA